MESNEQMLHDILETVNFIKDNAATKSELSSVAADLETRLGSRMDRLEVKVDERFNDIMNHVDAFTKLHETLDQEMVSLRGKYDRLEERLVRVEQKLGFAGV